MKTAFSLTPRLVAFLGCMSASIVHADVLVDNITEPTRGVTKLGTVAPDDIWAAQAFTGSRPYTLDSIELILGDAIDLVGPVAELRSGDDPSGPALATFAVPALSGVGVERVVLVPDAPVGLQAGVQYWIVLGTSGTGEFGWAYASGNNYTGTGTIGGYAYSNDQGVTWGGIGFDNPYHMLITVTIDCSCRADFNCDGTADFFDYLDFVAAFDAEDLAADFNGDSQVDFFDYLDFVAAFDAGC